MDEYIERNIKTLEAEADKTKIFGPTSVQRTCIVSYLQARFTLDVMVAQGKIEIVNGEIQNYKWVKK